MSPDHFGKMTTLKVQNDTKGTTRNTCNLQVNLIRCDFVLNVVGSGSGPFSISSSRIHRKLLFSTGFECAYLYQVTAPQSNALDP